MPLKTWPGEGVDRELDRLVASCSLPMFCSGMGKSTQIGSSACSVTSARPGETYWPSSDLADAEPAGERRQDRLLRDERLDAVDGGGRRVALGQRRVDRCLGRDRLDQKVGLPLVGDVGLAQRRFGAGEVGLLHRDVELHELGALVHVLPALEAELR